MTNKSNIEWAVSVENYCIYDVDPVETYAISNGNV